jgi:hypothetical protein
MKKKYSLIVFIIILIASVILQGCIIFNPSGSASPSESAPSPSPSESSSPSPSVSPSPSPSPEDNGAIIVDHRYATLSTLQAIPESYLLNAQDDLHVYYNHTSHGSQLTDGMSSLIEFMNGLSSGQGAKFTYNSSGESDMQLWDSYSTDLGNSDWDNITRTFIENNSGVNVIMWSWCGQVSWMSETEISGYLSKMSALETEFPGIKFIYMTGHTDGTGETGNLHLRNEQIREYCRENEKILFDYADIESYDPDGNYYMDKDCNDNCDYDTDGNGSLDGNWAIEWQDTHTENVHWYQCGAAHSQPLNSNMKAYAAWYLFARLAGYQG